MYTGTNVEHNDTNLVEQRHDDVAKVTEMTLINAFHSSLVCLHMNRSRSSS